MPRGRRSASPCGDGAGDPPPPQQAQPDAAALAAFPACPADGSADFAHYYLGQQFQGLPLEGVLRTCDPPAPIDGIGPVFRTNDILYIYGTCTSPPTEVENGCAVPVVVKSAPACEVNLALYKPGFGPGLDDLVARRGTLAALLDDDTAIELYSGDATVSVTAKNADQAHDALLRLRSGPENLLLPLNQNQRGSGLAELNQALSTSPPPAIDVGDLLPDPLAGALEGDLPC